MVLMLSLLIIVDDGSAVIAVHHTFRQSALTPPRPKPRSPPSQGRKGKERQIDDIDCGIPEEYRLPPPPPLPRSSSQQRSGNKFNSKSSYCKTVNVSNYFVIGEIVSVVGRIDLWVDRRERIVTVDRVLQTHKESNLERADHEGYIEVIEDVNEEPRHLLSALRLSATEYSTAFETAELIAEKLPGKNFDRFDAANFIRPTRRLRESIPCPQHSEEDPPRRKLRVMDTVPDDDSKGVHKRPLGVTRRLLSSSIHNTKRAIANKGEERQEDDKRRKLAATKEVQSVDSVLSNQQSIPSASGHHRQLRNYTKLPDSKMTESTFRVYVEKHLLDYCSRELKRTTYSDCKAMPKLSDRHSRNGKDPSRLIMKSEEEPPAFTLKYLQRVTLLREHARRTVEVATRRREEKRKRQEQSGKAKVASTSAKKVVVASSETVDDKMERLYASVLRAMLMDGIIVLASPAQKVMTPFNGKPPQSQIDEHPQLDWEGLSKAALSSSISSSSLSSCDSGQGYRRAPIQQEAYQVVMPTLLAIPILEATTDTMSSLQLVQKMQAKDDRWKFLRLESVQEGLQYLQDKAV